MKWLLLLAILVGCSTPRLESRNALVNQILRPRSGHAPMLTNQICKSYDKSGHCSSQVVEYDLRIQKTRELLNDLKFRCRVANKNYRICRDRPGLCYRGDPVAVKKFLWFPLKWESPVVTLDIVERYDFLLSSKTECVSLNRFNAVK